LFEQLPEKLKRYRSDNKKAVKKKRSASSLNPGTSQGLLGSPDLSIPVPLNKSQRATTFPMQFTAKASASTREGGSFESKRNHPALSISHENLRQNLQELVSPPTISAVGTPDSSSTGSLQPPQFTFQQFGNNDGIPDLGAMMFPSADPFAYPNQPMFELDNRQQKQEMMGNMMESNPVPNMYMGNGGVSSPYGNIEGQLFGPLPPYLVQGQANYDISQMGMGGMPGINVTNMGGNSGLTQGSGMNYDGNLFDQNTDEWNNMFADQGYRQ
jgi:hypothetical protein